MTSRQTKTPTQRAQEAVDVLHRRVMKLRAKHREARDQVEELEREIQETEGRLLYARQNPDLPQQQLDTDPAGATTT